MEKWLRKRYIRQAALELWEGGDCANTFVDLVTEVHMTEDEAQRFIDDIMPEVRREQKKLNEWLDGGGEIVDV